jgi:hypothetical protein
MPTPSQPDSPSPSSSSSSSPTASPSSPSSPSTTFSSAENMLSAQSDLVHALCGQLSDALLPPVLRAAFMIRAEGRANAAIQDALADMPAGALKPRVARVRASGPYAGETVFEPAEPYAPLATDPIFGPMLWTTAKAAILAEIEELLDQAVGRKVARLLPADYNTLEGTSSPGASPSTASSPGAAPTTATPTTATPTTATPSGTAPSGSPL